jgi:acetyltransferase-like isoleucine patch superfamily enzyme
VIGLSRVRGIVAARSVRGSVDVAGDARIGRGVRITVAAGGSLRIGRGCRVGDGCRVVVCAGSIDLGDGCVLGEQCTLIARREITIGERSRLGDGVSVLDFGPAPTDTERPTRVQPLHAARVVVGADVEIGLRAAIGPGIELAAGARVEPGVVLGGLADPLLAGSEPPPAGAVPVVVVDAGGLSSSGAGVEATTGDEVGE